MHNGKTAETLRRIILKDGFYCASSRANLVRRERLALIVQGAKAGLAALRRLAWAERSGFNAAIASTPAITLAIAPTQNTVVQSPFAAI